MKRRPFLDTLRIVRQREQYVQRASLYEAIGNEQQAAELSRQATVQVARAQQLAARERALASQKLRGAGLRGFEGQQLTEWLRASKGTQAVLSERARRLSLALRDAEGKTSHIRGQLGRVSSALEQIKRRLLQQRLADWLRLDAADSEAQDDRSLHLLSLRALRNPTSFRN